MHLVILASFVIGGIALTNQNPISSNTSNNNEVSSKHRIIIETDAPGGDPDDEGSLVRFFLYLNEWDVEGMIGTRPAGESRLGIAGDERIHQYIDDYQKVYPNLIVHDPNYPDPKYLRSISKQCYEGTESRDCVISVIDKSDPRPVWYLNWGTNEKDDKATALREALDYIKRTRSSDDYHLFASKINYVELYLRDFIGSHKLIIPLYIDTFYPTMDGGRWYHRWRPLTEKAGGFEIEKDIKSNHGPLCANYTITKEGDTPTFMFLIPNGLNEPMRLDWGSWSGRYSYNNDNNMWWCDQQDNWNGTLSRDNTLKRWAVHIQNDFKSRADWCVANQYENANHPPIIVVEKDKTVQPLFINVTVGQNFQISAFGTTDPDDDLLNYQWIYYPEAGSYKGEIKIENSDQQECNVNIPNDAKGKKIHMLLIVTDTGTPALTRYRRIILNGI